MDHNGVSKVLALETDLKNQVSNPISSTVCLLLEMKQKPSNCKSSAHAQGSITMLHTSNALA